jgi:hypothetical protein
LLGGELEGEVTGEHKGVSVEVEDVRLDILRFVLVLEGISSSSTIVLLPPSSGGVNSLSVDSELELVGVDLEWLYSVRTGRTLSWRRG